MSFKMSLPPRLPLWHFRAVCRAVCKRWVYCNLFSVFFSIIDVRLGCKLLNEVQCISLCHGVLETLPCCRKWHLIWDNYLQSPMLAMPRCQTQMPAFISFVFFRGNAKDLVCYVFEVRMSNSEKEQLKVQQRWQGKGKSRKINTLCA